MSLNTMSSMFFLAVLIHGTRLNPLLDSGASNNFISDSLVDVLHLRRHKLAPGQKVFLADGIAYSVTDYVRARLTFPAKPHPFSIRTVLRVTPMGNELILGLPFFRRVNPQIDWRARAFKAHLRGRQFQVEVLNTVRPHHVLEAV
jgi:hypothetical protein